MALTAAAEIPRGRAATQWSGEWRAYKGVLGAPGISNDVGDGSGAAARDESVSAFVAGAESGARIHSRGRNAPWLDRNWLSLAGTGEPAGNTPDGTYDALDPCAPRAVAGRAGG